MSLSKKDRKAMRQALSFLDGFTFTEDEDEFMAGSGLGGISLDLGRCLDDLGEKDKEIEALNSKISEFIYGEDHGESYPPPPGQ